MWPSSVAIGLLGKTAPPFDGHVEKDEGSCVHMQEKERGAEKRQE